MKILQNNLEEEHTCHYCRSRFEYTIKDIEECILDTSHTYKAVNYRHKVISRHKEGVTYDSLADRGPYAYGTEEVNLTSLHVKPVKNIDVECVTCPCCEELNILIDFVGDIDIKSFKIIKTIVDQETQFYDESGTRWNIIDVDTEFKIITI